MTKVLVPEVPLPWVLLSQAPLPEISALLHKPSIFQNDAARHFMTCFN